MVDDVVLKVAGLVLVVLVASAATIVMPFVVMTVGLATVISGAILRTGSNDGADKKKASTFLLVGGAILLPPVLYLCLAFSRRV